MKKYLYGICLLIACSIQAQTKVGEEVTSTHQSPHPYQGNMTSVHKMVWSQEVSQKDAGYVAVHFSKIQLAANDYIVVRDVNNTRSWKYSDNTIQKRGNSFWSIPIYDDKMIIEIFSSNSKGGFGYIIDIVAKGYPLESIRAEQDEALCGADDSRNAICYSNNEPNAYNRSRAVARLLINGTSACTGWLIGDNGQLMTNEHCIQNQADANNVTVEFMAQGANCNSNCDSWLACSGTVEATSANLIRANAPLDYALLQLNTTTNLPQNYGFLQLRNTGAVINERIYIPQHPRAWGKRIALLSTNTNDQGGVARIFSLTRPRCGGSGNDIGYFADTQGGSSGSPVLGYGDDLVVALHHCANCPNRGVPIEEIIQNLGNDLPPNALPSNGCPDNLTVTQNVPSGTTDNQEAANMLTANNTISNGGIATYTAGQKVTLSTGFKASSGSKFTAKIQNCTTSREVESTSIEENKSVSAIDKPEFEDFVIHPNPTNHEFTISTYSLKNLDNASIKVYDILGAIKLKQDISSTKNNVNVQTLKEGLYYIIISTNNGISISKKLLIKR
ncbi:3-coathanger stack domain-containing protein [Aquimarina macrocephali]|uniref:T9SS type A sorting domain-containing protein n=1 Tax=Aquimarina macrocephali TaxID=666563 RepID=UPI0004660C8C|nr:3-coathanger stack domain-containing protein [Aquimarina macrocephali]